MVSVSDKCYRGNQNEHFTFNNFFFNCAIYEVMQKKYCRARQAIDGYIAHAPFMLDTYSYKLTL